MAAASEGRSFPFYNLLCPRSLLSLIITAPVLPCPHRRFALQVAPTAHLLIFSDPLKLQAWRRAPRSHRQSPEWAVATGRQRQQRRSGSGSLGERRRWTSWQNGWGAAVARRLLASCMGQVPRARLRWSGGLQPGGAAASLRTCCRGCPALLLAMPLASEPYAGP